MDVACRYCGCMTANVPEHEPACPLNPENWKPKTLNQGPVGWTCPVCGRCLSPYALVCPCHAERPTVMTSGTSTLVEGERP